MANLVMQVRNFFKRLIGFIVPSKRKEIEREELDRRRGKLLRRIVGIPSEMRGNLYGLISILANVQANQSRRIEWNIQFYRFVEEGWCKVSFVTVGEKKLLSSPMLYDERKEDSELCRLAEAVFKLPEGLLNALCVLAEKLASDQGKVWHEGLRDFVEGKECSISAMQKVKTYLRVIFTLESRDGYRLKVYELVEKGTFKEIFGSLRGGKFDRICFLSREEIGEQCHNFEERFRSIKGNEVVFFLHYDGGLTKEKNIVVGYVNFYSTLIKVLDFPFDSKDVWEPMKIGSRDKKSERRIFVALERP